VATAAIAAGLVIAGCSAEEPGPDFTPTLPPSKSSSALDGDEETAPVDEDEEAQPNPAASPDLKPPPIPPEIEEKTLEGAEAAARYYIDVFNYGYSSYDTEPIESISLPDCETCAHHVEVIRNLKDQEQTFDGGNVEADSESSFYENGDRIVVELIVRQAPSKIVNVDGSVEKTNNAEHIVMWILANWQETGWKIGATDNEEAPE